MYAVKNKYPFLLVLFSLLALSLLMAWPFATPAIATATELINFNDTSSLGTSPESFSGVPFTSANFYEDGMVLADSGGVKSGKATDGNLVPLAQFNAGFFQAYGW